jgi:hypothetical protein
VWRGAPERQARAVRRQETSAIPIVSPSDTARIEQVDEQPRHAGELASQDQPHTCQHALAGTSHDLKATGAERGADAHPECAARRVKSRIADCCKQHRDPANTPNNTDCRRSVASDSDFTCSSVLRSTTDDPC